MLDADIRDFFTSLDQAWLERFLEHRIADRRVLRLIQKWLRAGVIEDGEWSETDQGTPQGASVSTLLANVYLHYVFDLWVDQWRGRHARGEVIVVRYATTSWWASSIGTTPSGSRLHLRERFARFGLGLHEDKTRLIEFGRFAAQSREARGLGKPETFEFLGFTHICAKSTGRVVQAAADHEQEADAGEATRGQDRADASPAPTDSRARSMAAERGAWAQRLLRRARQQPVDHGVPQRGHTALEAGAQPPRPTRPSELETDAPDRRPLATDPPNPPSMARRALRRQNPRQEPSALRRTLGSVRGAASNGGPYRNTGGRRCCCRRI